MLPYRTGHLQHITQVSAAILVRRRTYRTEHHLHVIQHGGEIRCELQTSGIIILMDHILQARLVNRDDTLLQILDLLGHHIHTRNVHTHLRKTGTRYQTDISCPDNRYFHTVEFIFIDYNMI